MAKGPPKVVALDNDEYDAKYVGRTEDGRQFFLTTPFIPAIGKEPGREFIALYVFDRAGELRSVLIDDLGPRATMDEAARVTRRDDLLASLGGAKYRRIKVAAVPGRVLWSRIRVHPTTTRGAGRGLERDRRAGQLHVLLATVDQRRLRHLTGELADEPGPRDTKS